MKNMVLLFEVFTFYVLTFNLDNLVRCQTGLDTALERNQNSSTAQAVSDKSLDPNIVSLLQNSVLGNSVAFDPLNSLGTANNKIEETPVLENVHVSPATAVSVQPPASSENNRQRIFRQTPESRIFLLLGPNAQRSQVQPNQILRAAGNSSVLLVTRWPSRTQSIVRALRVQPRSNLNGAVTSSATAGRPAGNIRTTLSGSPAASNVPRQRPLSTSATIRPVVLRQNNLVTTISQPRPSVTPRQQQLLRTVTQQARLPTSGRLVSRVAGRRVTGQSIGQRSSLQNARRQTPRQLPTQNRRQSRVRSGRRRNSVRREASVSRPITDPFQQRFSAGFSFGDRLLTQPPLENTGFDGTRRAGIPAFGGFDFDLTNTLTVNQFPTFGVFNRLTTLNGFGF